MLIKCVGNDRRPPCGWQFNSETPSPTGICPFCQGFLEPNTVFPPFKESDPNGKDRRPDRS